MSFTQKIVAAMAAGIVVGALIGTFADPAQGVAGFFVQTLFASVGEIFVRLLQMMVVPLVLTSLVCGVTALGDMRSLGRLGIKTVGLYLVTTSIALVIALTFARSLSPGAGFELGADVEFESETPPTLGEVLVNMFPANPIQALAEGQMLQIIVFALLLGFAISHSGAAGERVTRVFSDFNDVVMRMVLIVVAAAPVGVFALIAETFATQGLDVLRPLAGYFGTVVLCLAFHLAVTYPSLVRLAGLSPLRFLGKMRAVMTFAFSTSSSNATIPMTLSTVEKRLGVDNRVAAFTVPLGATINMDGTAIMQGVATVFIANVYGVDLSLVDLLTVVLTATLASIGTAGVPSAGLIMLAMVLTQVGLPVEGVGLILGIDRLLDMMRTAVNVTGDAAVTSVIARSEGALDTSVFDDPEAAVVAAAAHHSPV